MRNSSPSRKPAAAMAVALLLVGLAAGSPAARAADRIERGQAVRLAGGQVAAWARLDARGVPEQVGVGVSHSILTGPPAAPGTGPAGASAVVGFPREVQESTFFNHFELHAMPHGHGPEPFGAPHFDLHFYRLAPAQVARIIGPDRDPPAASRLPEGWLYLGAGGFTPQMGVHAVKGDDLRRPFTATLVLGYSGGRLNFLEPMVAMDLLRQRRDFSLEVPVPRVLDGRLLFPTRFDGYYDADTDSWQFVFSGFVEAAR